jgi:hypothetical protein
MFNRFFRFQPGRDHPNLVFWVVFFILNLLLFLPLYLFNQETTTLLPAPSLFADGLLNGLFLWRENLDPFRLSLELSLLFVLWINVRRWQGSILRGVIMASYLLALCYYLYEAIMLSIYLADPVFYSHYFLARDGLPFLARHLQTSFWIYAIAILGLGVAVTVLLVLLNILLTSAAQPTLHRGTRVAVIALAAFGLFTGVRYQYYTARPEMFISSLGYKLQQNIAASFQLHHDVVSFDDLTVRRSYDYSRYRLQQKPDIYLIFIESYGSVLYKQPAFRRMYLDLLAEVEGQLEQAGWQTASALSESPTWGGGSWMAYTSSLFGLRIDNHPQYLALLNKYQVEMYPDLGRYFQSQGYYYAWVSSISRELDDLAWAKYIRFLGVDAWIRHSDLQYNGLHYGWGPAPPDQYVLHYANETLQQRTEKPLLFVTLTQNSHYPWAPQPELVADWHELTQAGTEETEQIAAVNADERRPLRQEYFKAIEYQLHMLTDFILRTGNENSLFVLIGDHQPPRVSRRADGFDTPVHIISQDGAFLDAFAEYGFTPGLQPKTHKPSLHHEGFYSLFVHVLLEHHGADRIALPAYLPNGVSANKTVQSTLDEP